MPIPPFLAIAIAISASVGEQNKGEKRLKNRISGWGLQNYKRRIEKER
jgi:hypothetical protein